MKRIFRVSVAVLLAVILTVLQPVQAVAAGTKTYISNIIIETGNTAKDAKEKLTAAGYTVFDKNISSTVNGFEHSGYMYIGYKTTKNAEEAITDIRTMNMGGGYSYAEYDELINQKTEEIGAKMDELMNAVKEYRTNYKANKKSAIFAYKMLSNLIEDDSQVLLSDFLLDEGKTRADYIKLFMQCSTVVYSTVCKALAVACSGTNEKSLMNLSEIDNADLEGELQYEKIAADIYASLPLAQTLLAPYATSGVTTADGATPEDIDEKYEQLTEEEKATWNESFAFAYLLESIELADGSTLYDLVTTDLDELTTEDLYAFASVLSDGQAALIRTAGLMTVLSMAMLDDKQWNGMEEYLADIDEPISVYTGVDRSLFQGGVALTSKAMVEAAANADEEWFGFELNNEDEEKLFRIMTISLFTATGAISLYLVSTGAFNWLSSAISHLVLRPDYYVNVALGGDWAASWLFQRTAMEITQTVMLYIGQIMTYITWAAIGVLLVASAILLIANGYAYYNPTYDEIPHILVDKIVGEKEESVYINYYSVKKSDGKTIVDIAQHNGARWVTLYTTKDKNAGNPILADLAFSDKNILDGYDGICRFSETVPFNINKYAFYYGENICRDGKDDYEKVRDLYLYCKHAPEERSNYGSIFSSGNWIIGLGGLFVGVLGGVTFCKAKDKKKKTVAVAE